MASLFDLIQSGDPAVQNGLLNFGLSLLQSKGNFGNAVGRAGQAGQIGARDYRQQEALLKRTGLTDQMLQMQMDEQKRKLDQQRQLEALAAQFTRSPQQQAMAQNGGPTMAAANAIPTTQPGFDYQGYVNALAGMNPMAALDMQGKLQKETLNPIKLGEGDTLIDPKTYKQIATNPKPITPEKMPNAVQEYQFAVSQGYAKPFNDWVLEKSRAGAARTSVDMKIENKMGEGVAKEIGPMIKSSYDTAAGAQTSIATADRLIKAVDSGNVYTGPGATFRLRAAQIGQSLGIGGKDIQDQIANTRSAIQGLAQSTVAARSALKGQGQVSDFEGRLLERAASGNVDDLTAAEIKQIATVNKRLAQQQISNHSQMVSKLRTKDATAQLADMFDLPTVQTGDTSAPSGMPGMPGMSAIDAELARRAAAGGR